MSSNSGGSKNDKQIFGLTLGAEPKQIAALGGLLVLLLVVWLVMRNPSDDSPTSTQGSAGAKAQNGPDSPAGRAAARAAARDDAPGGPRRQGSRQALSAAVKEFRPSLKRDRDDPIDPSRTDPTIRFVALTKVQGVQMAGGGRSLFDFGPMTAPMAKN